MKEIQTLIWSEWRRQRKTVLLLVASTVLLWLFMTSMVLLKTFVKEIEMTAVALVIGLPFLYCIALGGSFANEFSDKSKSFLLGLPVSKTKIYFAKYLSNILIFLLISIASSLLIYTLTGLTPGKTFFDDLGIWTCPTAIIALLIVWILSHTTVFLYNLISRSTSSGIIALLTLPIIFVIVSFATSSVTMFCFSNDQTWVIVYTLLSSIIIYLFMIGLGWYLWNKRISQDLKCLKPVSIAVIILFIVPALPYSAAYLYTKYQYDSALNAAKQSGLELERKRQPQPTKIPDASNGMLDIMQFSKDKKQLLFNKTYEKFSRIFPNHREASWTNPKFKYYVNPAKKGQVANYIINNPDMRKLYLSLKKALSKPEIQYIIQYNKAGWIKSYSHYYEYTSAISSSSYFLMNRAYAQRYFGNNKAFFKTLTEVMKLSKSLRKINSYSTDCYDYGNYGIRKTIYCTIIKAGPEGSAYINDYAKVLKMSKNDIFSLNSNGTSFERFQTWVGHIYRNKPVLALGIALCVNFRLKQKFASAVMLDIEYNKLYSSAKNTHGLKKIIEKFTFLENKHPYSDVYYPFNWGLRPYFQSRSIVTGNRLCLALKIYRCRYGKYPDKLQKLCPEILKEIPLEPRTETPYVYIKEGKGFALYGGKDEVPEDMLKSGGSYIPYYKKYQPWNPQGKEKVK